MKDLTNNITELGKKLTKASSKLIKNTQLNIKLSSEEEKIRKIYIEIGQKVHEIYSYGGNIGKFFDEKYAEILNTEDKIRELKKTIDIEKEKPFIANNISQSPLQQGQQETFIDTMPKQGKVCNACGEINDHNDKFCLKCGRGI